MVPATRPRDRADVLAAVRQPTSRLSGRRPGEEWWYRRHAGPSRWLKVVVANEGTRGEIRTAFARRAFHDVTVGELTFDNVVYDRDADVLYLHVGDPAAAVEFDESPEGHALRYDAAGHLVGITIVSPRWLLEHDGAVTITLPQPVRVDRSVLAAAIGPR